MMAETQTGPAVEGEQRFFFFPLFVLLHIQHVEVNSVP